MENTLMFLSILLASSTMGFRIEQAKDVMEVPVRLDRSDDDSDAVVFDAFGEGYRLKLEPAKVKRLESVDLYSFKDGIIRKELQTEEPVDVYQDDNYLVAVERKESRYGPVPKMDGYIGVADNVLYSRSRPNMMFHDGLRHFVSKRNDGRFANDYVDLEDTVADKIMEKRSDEGNLNAVVDLLVVADYAIFMHELRENRGDVNKALSEIRKYYKLLVAMVDKRYARINDPDLSIRVRLVGIFVAQDPLGSPWSEGHTISVDAKQILDPPETLERFHKWLKEQMKGNVLPKHDHAMAFTRYMLYNLKTDSDTAGMAYIGTICKVSEGFSASIVEETGGFANIAAATHELGHSLGAHHDGVGNGDRCSAMDNYIMTPQSSGGGMALKNIFTFSPCTIATFKTKFRSEQAKCLFDSKPREFQGKLPGQLLSADEQCRKLFGPGSGVCKLNALTNNICLRLWCKKPNSPKSCLASSSTAAIYGTSCGDGKICANGDCIPEKEVLTKEEENRGPPCPNGDRNRRYCAHVMRISPKSCDRSDIGSYCCQTCRHHG